MKGRLVVCSALATVSARIHAHENLELDGALHRALHAVGTERLVVLGGVLLAIVVAVIVRHAARKAAHRRRES